jgi:hypothetical protein
MDFFYWILEALFCSAVSLRALKTSPPVPSLFSDWSAAASAYRLNRTRRISLVTH